MNAPMKGVQYKYSRVIRYVDEAALPVRDCISVLDRDANVLIIVRSLFDRLDRFQQKRVLNTDEPILYWTNR